MSTLSDSVRRLRHAGPRNTEAICLAHIKEHGSRPTVDGLAGPARATALKAQQRWDTGLMARSPVIAQSVNNDVCMIDGNGMLVPKRRK
jgi:hypothetical protein